MGWSEDRNLNEKKRKRAGGRIRLVPHLSDLLFLYCFMIYMLLLKLNIRIPNRFLLDAK